MRLVCVGATPAQGPRWKRKGRDEGGEQGNGPHVEGETHGWWGKGRVIRKRHSERREGGQRRRDGESGQPPQRNGPAAVARLQLATSSERAERRKTRKRVETGLDLYQAAALRSGAQSNAGPIRLALALPHACRRQLCQHARTQTPSPAAHRSQQQQRRRLHPAPAPAPAPAAITTSQHQHGHRSLAAAAREPPDPPANPIRRVTKHAPAPSPPANPASACPTGRPAQTLRRTLHRHHCSAHTASQAPPPACAR